MFRFSRHLLVAVLAASTLLFGGGAALAQDTCSTAILVSGPLPIDVPVNTSANADTSVSACITFDGPGGNDVWLRLPTLTNGTTYRVRTTAGTIGDTVVEVFRTTSTCGALVAVGCNDDANGASLLSDLTFVAAAGNTYYVHAESYDPGGGTFTIKISNPPPALTNNTCATAKPIPSVPYYDEINVSGGTNTGDFDNNPSNGVSGIDAFWRFIPAETGTYTVLGENTDPGGTMCLGFWTGVCGTLSTFGGAPTLGFTPSVTRILTGGVSYYIIYDDAFPGSAPQNVSILLTGGPVAPPNDTCTAASALALGFPDTVDMQQANHEGRDVSIASALGLVALKDVYYAYNSTAAGTYSIRVDEAGGSPFVGVFTGSCGVLVELDSTAPGGYFDSDSTELNIRLNSGTSYRILSESSVPMQITSTSINGPFATPTGDTCADPINITGSGTQFADISTFTNDIINSVTLARTPGNVDLGGRDVFYRYTPGSNGMYDFSVTGGADLSLSLYTGACGALTESLVADTQSPPGGYDPATYTETEELLGVSLSAGVPVFIVLDGLNWDDNSEFGPWTFDYVDLTPPGPANDFCADAEALTLGVPDVVSLEFASDEGLDSSLRTAFSTTGLVDAFYTFTPAADGMFAIRADQTGGDPSLALYTGSCGALAEVGAVLTGMYNELASAELNHRMTSGTTYTILVESTLTTTPITVGVSGPLVVPAGDTCADALTASGSATLMIDVTNMANDSVNSISFNALGVPADLGGRDAFIAYTPANTANHDISVEGGADLSVAILTGTCGSLTEIAAADAVSPPGIFTPSTYTETEEILAFGLTQGVVVYIVVDGLTWDSNGQFGPWELTIVDPTPPPPANDLCSGAEALTLATPAVVSLEFANDEGLDGSLLTAIGEASVVDVFYTFTPAADGMYRVRADQAAGSPAVAVFTGACGALVEVGSVVTGLYNTPNGAELNARMTLGTQYTILTESTTTATDVTTMVSGPLVVPTGDTCADALTQVGPGSLMVNVTNMANDTVNSVSLNAAGFAADFGGRDAFIHFTPGNTGAHDLWVSGGADLSITVLSGTCGTLTEVAAEDSVRPTLGFDPPTYTETESLLGIALTQGVPVYVVVDGLSWDDNGQFGSWTVTFIDQTSVKNWMDFD